ncbi:MAG: TetR/AcrR family transcriptional regulator [Pseudomonadota bacterium]
MSAAGVSERQSDRDGAATRTRLLDVAFAEIYEHGYQGLRVDTLLAKAGLTKGAFYHHFESKTALGLAVIDELLAGLADLVWRQHLAQYDDPIEGIEASASFALGLLGPRATTLGCPINNLAQEMSGLDPAFQQRLAAVFQGIIDNIATALERGKASGVVRGDVDSRAAAIFILAAVEGAIGIAKGTRSEAALQSALVEARRYLATLRAASADG